MSDMLKLTGPVARESFGVTIADRPGVGAGGYWATVCIETWTVRDHEDRWHKGDKERFRKLSLEAYEKRPASAPNPALVPLDPDEEGGPFVYALIRLEVPDVLRSE